MKKILALSLLATLAGCGGPADPDAPTPIKIGYIGPLSGNAYDWGESSSRATELAVEKINAAGGVDGHPLKIIYEDGKCGGKDAVTAFYKLLNLDGVKIIFGGVCSGESMAFAPLGNARKILMFSDGSSTPELTAPDFFFRNYPPDDAPTKAAAQNLWDRGIRRLAVITENSGYTAGVRDVLLEKWTELGGEIVADEILNPDFLTAKPELTKIKFSDPAPDAIFLNSNGGRTGGIFAKQARELGIELPFFGNVAIPSPDFFEMAGKWAEGTTAWTALPDEDYPATREFLDEFAARFGHEPPIPLAATNAVDRANLTADALRSCGGTDADTECLRDYLSGVKDYRGLSGIYSFDKNGDVKMNFTELVARDGKFVRAGGSEDIPAGSGSATEK